MSRLASGVTTDPMLEPNLVPQTNNQLHFSGMSQPQQQCTITSQTMQSEDFSRIHHSLAELALEPADHPKLAAVPAALMLAADDCLVGTAVLAYDLPGDPDCSQPQAAGTETDPWAAVSDCAKEPVDARVLAHAQSHQACQTASVATTHTTQQLSPSCSELALPC